MFISPQYPLLFATLPLQSTPSSTAVSQISHIPKTRCNQWRNQFAPFCLPQQRSYIQNGSQPNKRAKRKRNSNSNEQYKKNIEVVFLKLRMTRDSDILNIPCGKHNPRAILERPRRGGILLLRIPTSSLVESVCPEIHLKLPSPNLVL